MNSVTRVIRNIKQPNNGVLPLSKFRVHNIGGDIIKCDKIPPILVGKIVDSMLHVTIRSNKEKLFRSSISGYNKRIEYFARQFSYNNGFEFESKRIEQEDGMFNVYSLINRLDGYMKEFKFYELAICLSLIHQYDIWDSQFSYMSTTSSIVSSRPKYFTKGDIRKIVQLYKRTLDWLCKIMGKDNITFDYKFYPDGYTQNIQYGVGDFICNNMLIDLKCTQSNPTTINTLQILTYYVMGLHSNNKLYKNISSIGIYSPILNKLWYLGIDSIPNESIKFVEDSVLEYSK